MRENKDKKPEIFVSESRAGSDRRGKLPAAGPKAVRKYAIIGLMVLVFMGCLYLIFAPSGEQAPEVQAAKGLNRAVPQAMGADMPADKAKAYEQEMLQQRNEEKRRAVASLSDYWQQQEKGDSVKEPPAPGKLSSPSSSQETRSRDRYRTAAPVSSARWTPMSIRYSPGRSGSRKTCGSR